MFDQRRHGSNASTRASHWLSRKSFDWCLQLALAASPNRTSPSAYNNTFFRPLDSRGVALVEQARSGLTWHDMHYGPTVCRRRILRALFVPFHLRSRRQPAFCLHPQLAMSSCLREHATSGSCFRTVISLVPVWKKWWQNDMKHFWRCPIAGGIGNVETNRRQGC